MFSIIACLLTIPIFGSIVLAQDKKETPKPEIKGLSALGAARGTTLTLILFGENFIAPTVTIATPKITILRTGAPEETKEDAEKQRGKFKITLELQIAADCPTDGAHLLTLAQAEHKVTKPFVVWELAATELAVKRPCRSPREAMPIEGDSVAVTGFLQDGDQPDLFRLDAKAVGEVWEIALLAGRAGSPMDGVLRVRDSKGLPVAFAAGDESKDRKIRFVAPTAGAFYVEVSEAEGRGGKQMLYRLTVRRGK